jgi:hypothetical protein
MKTTRSCFGGTCTQLVALRHVFILVLPISPVRITAPLLLTHRHIYDFRDRRTNAAKAGNILIKEGSFVLISSGYMKSVPGSSVGIATGYGLDGPGI